MMNYEQQQQLIKSEANRFPAEFGLRAFPGERFKIMLSDSYISDGRVVLYTGIKTKSGFQAFAKGSAGELIGQIVDNDTRFTV
jgi:hypothetical protein